MASSVRLSAYAQVDTFCTAPVVQIWYPVNQLRNYARLQVCGTYSMGAGGGGGYHCQLPSRKTCTWGCRSVGGPQHASKAGTTITAWCAEVREPPSQRI
jgi:hypothetical protein